MSTSAVARQVVQVAGWDKERELRIEGEEILFEVGRIHNMCGAGSVMCPTCKAHVTKITAYLKHFGHLHTWVNRRWLCLPAIANMDPVRQVVEQTGLEINGIRPEVSQGDILNALQPREEKQLHVPSWQQNRAFIIEEGRVLFQVTLSCRHCPTCQRRVRQVSEAIQASGVATSWEYLSGWDDVTFLAIPRQPGEDLLELLKRVTKLDVRDFVAERKAEEVAARRTARNRFFGWVIGGIALLFAAWWLYSRY